MNKLARYARRLILWFERPLRSEEKQLIWNQACAWQYNKLMQELGPIMQVQPYQHNQPPKLPPLTIRQRAHMQKLRATLPPIQETEPSPVLPAVQSIPVQFDKIIDESWFNDVPVSIIEDEMSTEHVPAISKLLHGGNR